MRTPTATDIKPERLKSFLKSFGFILKCVKGDHFIYYHPALDQSVIIIIPMSNPVKPVYIDQIRRCIKEIDESNE